MFKKYIDRIFKNALDRWRDKVADHGAAKARSNQVLGKMRLRFQKEAFKRFKEFHLKGKQYDKNEDQLADMKETLRIRSLRKYYHAFCAFTHHHKKAKKYWKRIFCNYDLL